VRLSVLSLVGSDQFARLHVARALRTQQVPGSLLFTSDGRNCRIRDIPPGVANCLEYFRIKGRPDSSNVRLRD
jgi:hypothetical protein